VLPAALAALCLLAVAALLWLGPGRPAGPLEITELRVTHYRDRGRTLVGDLRTNPAAVRVEDDVRLVAKLSAPAYCYLIAFNPDGTAQLRYPTAADGEGAPAARPAAAAEVRYPLEEHAFVLDAAGWQAFVLAASRKPLPPYREWKDRAGTPPWEGRPEVGAWGWHFDGREFARFPEERGKVVPRDGVPPALQKLRDFFVKRPEFETIQIIAFPVGKGPE
jgi:hypothetical protein